MDVMRFATNLLKLWVTVVNGFFSAFGTNDHQYEEVSCIMTFKKRSSMVKETKGYKMVSLVWYILLCALCNHTESRIATD